MVASKLKEEGHFPKFFHWEENGGREAHFGAKSVGKSSFLILLASPGLWGKIEVFFMEYCRYLHPTTNPKLCPSKLLYNAMPQAGVDALVAFMADFERRKG